MRVEFVSNKGKSVVLGRGDLVVVHVSHGEMDDNYRVARVVNERTVKPFSSGTVVDEPNPGELVSGPLINTDPRLHGPLGSLRFIPDN